MSSTTTRFTTDSPIHFDPLDRLRPSEARATPPESADPLLSHLEQEQHDGYLASLMESALDVPPLEELVSLRAGMRPRLHELVPISPDTMPLNVYSTPFPRFSHPGGYIIFFCEHLVFIADCALNAWVCYQPLCAAHLSPLPFLSGQMDCLGLTLEISGIGPLMVTARDHSGVDRLIAVDTVCYVPALEGVAGAYLEGLLASRPSIIRQAYLCGAWAADHLSGASLPPGLASGAPTNDRSARGRGQPAGPATHGGSVSRTLHTQGDLPSGCFADLDVTNAPAESLRLGSHQARSQDDPGAPFVRVNLGPRLSAAFAQTPGPIAPSLPHPAGSQYNHNFSNVHSGQFNASHPFVQPVSQPALPMGGQPSDVSVRPCAVHFGDYAGEWGLKSSLLTRLALLAVTYPELAAFLYSISLRMAGEGGVERLNNFLEVSTVEPMLSSLKALPVGEYARVSARVIAFYHRDRQYASPAWDKAMYETITTAVTTESQHVEYGLGSGLRGVSPLLPSPPSPTLARSLSPSSRESPVRFGFDTPDIDCPRWYTSREPSWATLMANARADGRAAAPQTPELYAKLIGYTMADAADYLVHRSTLVLNLAKNLLYLIYGPQQRLAIADAVTASLTTLSLAWDRAPLLANSRKLLNRKLNESHQVDDIGTILSVFDDVLDTAFNNRQGLRKFRAAVWGEGESARQFVASMIELGSDIKETDTSVLRVIEDCIYVRADPTNGMACAAATLAVAERLNAYKASCVRDRAAATPDGFRIDLKTCLSCDTPLVIPRAESNRVPRERLALQMHPQSISVNFQQPGLPGSNSQSAGVYVADASRTYVGGYGGSPMIAGYFNFAGVSTRMPELFGTSRVPHTARSQRRDGLFGISCFMCCDKGITKEYSHKEYEDLFGNKPYDKNARRIERDEVIVHHESKCFKVWSLARAHVKLHPEDAHILTPLTGPEWQVVATSLGF